MPEFYKSAWAWIKSNWWVCYSWQVFFYVWANLRHQVGNWDIKGAFGDFAEVLESYLVKMEKNIKGSMEKKIEAILKNDIVIKPDKTKVKQTEADLF